jgi:glycosyltransferase involved in cell wall biosynthesis
MEFCDNTTVIVYLTISGEPSNIVLRDNCVYDFGDNSFKTLSLVLGYINESIFDYNIILVEENHRKEFADFINFLVESIIRENSIMAECFNDILPFWQPALFMKYKNNQFEEIDMPQFSFTYQYSHANSNLFIAIEKVLREYYTLDFLYKNFYENELDNFVYLPTNFDTEFLQPLLNIFKEYIVCPYTKKIIQLHKDFKNVPTEKENILLHSLHPKQIHEYGTEGYVLECKEVSVFLNPKMYDRFKHAYLEHGLSDSVLQMITENLNSGIGTVPFVFNGLSSYKIKPWGIDDLPVIISIFPEPCEYMRFVIYTDNPDYEKLRVLQIFFQSLIERYSEFHYLIRNGMPSKLSAHVTGLYENSLIQLGFVLATEYCSKSIYLSNYSKKIAVS